MAFQPTFPLSIAPLSSTDTSPNNIPIPTPTDTPTSTFSTATDTTSASPGTGITTPGLSTAVGVPVTSSSSTPVAASSSNGGGISGGGIAGVAIAGVAIVGLLLGLCLWVRWRRRTAKHPTRSRSASLRQRGQSPAASFAARAAAAVAGHTSPGIGIVGGVYVEPKQHATPHHAHNFSAASVTVEGDEYAVGKSTGTVGTLGGADEDLYGEKLGGSPGSASSPGESALHGDHGWTPPALARTASVPTPANARATHAPYPAKRNTSTSSSVTMVYSHSQQGAYGSLHGHGDASAGADVQRQRSTTGRVERRESRRARRSPSASGQRISAPIAVEPRAPSRTNSQDLSGTAAGSPTYPPYTTHGHGHVHGHGHNHSQSHSLGHGRAPSVSESRASSFAGPTQPSQAVHHSREGSREHIDGVGAVTLSRSHSGAPAGSQRKAPRKKPVPRYSDEAVAVDAAADASPVAVAPVAGVQSIAPGQAPAPGMHYLIPDMPASQGAA